MPTPDTPDFDPHQSAEGSDEVVPLHWIKAASIAEGTSLLLLLLVAVPLKHMGGWPAAVQVMGPIHGLFFSAYLCMLVPTLSGGRWSGGEIARLLLLPLLPFGGYASAALLARTRKERTETTSTQGRRQ